MIELKVFIQFFTILAVTGSPQAVFKPSGITGSQFSTTPTFIHAAHPNSTLDTLTSTDLKWIPQPSPKPIPSSTPQPTPKPTPGPTPPPAPKPSPSPNPGPVPDPIMGSWTVKCDNSNMSCIVMDVAIQFEILDVNQTKNAKINLPADAISNGSCGTNRSNIFLTWNENKNNLEFDFMKSENGKFALELISVKFTNLTISDNDTKTYSLVHNKTEFPTPLDNSYKCARVQTLNLTEEKTNETVAYLHLSHVQFQAFSNTSGHKFELAMDCSSSLTTDVVPIVVGCVLAALVVMVLIAYLIGRRRCQARGYLSM